MHGNTHAIQQAHTLFFCEQTEIHLHENVWHFTELNVTIHHVVSVWIQTYKLSVLRTCGEHILKATCCHFPLNWKWSAHLLLYFTLECDNTQQTLLYENTSKVLTQQHPLICSVTNCCPSWLTATDVLSFIIVPCPQVSCFVTMLWSSISLFLAYLGKKNWWHIHLCIRGDAARKRTPARPLPEEDGSALHLDHVLSLRLGSGLQAGRQCDPLCQQSGALS